MTPVCTLRASTLAPGMTAPVESFTVPEILPVTLPKRRVGRNANSTADRRPRLAHRHNWELRSRVGTIGSGGAKVTLHFADSGASISPDCMCFLPRRGLRTIAQVIQPLRHGWQNGFVWRWNVVNDRFAHQW